MLEGSSKVSRQQQYGTRARDRPHSKGSLRGGNEGSFTEASWPPSPCQELETVGVAPETAVHRRIYSASSEQGYTPVSPSRPGASPIHSDDADDGLIALPFDGVMDFEDVKDLKRPLSRKKDPSASAAAGLGALSSPARVTDAFEQRKMRQPIPIESWGPRPPTRHGGLPNKVLQSPSLESTLDDESKMIPSSRNRVAVDAGVAPNVHRPSSKTGGDAVIGSKVVGGMWAAARADNARGASELQARGQSETRRIREKKDSPAFAGSRSPSQTMSKSLSNVFERNVSQQEAEIDRLYGTWATGDIVDGLRSPELSGLGESISPVAASWLSSPAGSSGAPPTRKGQRNSFVEAVSVEDVEGDLDMGLHVKSYRRDVISPQVIVTRSATGKKNAESRRNRDQRVGRERGVGGAGGEARAGGVPVGTGGGGGGVSGERQNTPFPTSLDPGFLSLFAT
eukprot:TRINITY_DN21894_c0_g1_i1.p1 TRINITY_DN21894_c0_g1~~TRINITY_DN21894_c0_g1_i1.p1  ORF type:complete len:453 (-),score=72.54 TRINITY_DN21894_c0_g1_i1:600-1958(-)